MDLSNNNNNKKRSHTQLDSRKQVIALVMYEFHYDYMIPKDGNNLKLCYMDMDSLVYHIKMEDFYNDITGDVKERFDMSGYDKADDRPLPIGLNKKVIGLMKD